jgi:transposase-like protein
MTKKTRKAVSPEQRKRITLALMEPGCDVGSLAKKYNLARSTLLTPTMYKKSTA